MNTTTKPKPEVHDNNGDWLSAADALPPSVRYCEMCGTRVSAPGLLCVECLVVFDYDGDTWTHQDAAAEALRHRIMAARYERVLTALRSQQDAVED